MSTTTTTTTGVRYDANRLSDLTEQRKSLLAKSKEILSAAKSGGRDLYAEEQATVEAASARIEKHIDPELKAQQKAMMRSILDLGGSDLDPDAPTTGGVFTPEDAKGFLAAVKQRGAFRTELPVKAALGTGGLDLPPTGQTVIPGAYPSAAFPLSQLFTVETTTSPVQRYYVLGNASAAVVPELGVKPDSGVTVTPKDVAVQKVATLCTFSDELAEDAAFLLQYLQQELTSAVVTTENQVIIDALGAASGLLTMTGPAADIIDLAASAIAGQEAISGSTPSAIVVAPSVLGQIRSSKSAGSGNYVIDPTAAAPSSLHGVALVSSVATPASTAWVVQKTAAVVYRRNAISAEIGWTGDQFKTNERTLRVEERVAVGVVRPSQVTKITLT